MQPINSSNDSYLYCYSLGSTQIERITLSITSVIFGSNTITNSDSLREIEITSKVFRVNDQWSFDGCNVLEKINITSDEIYFSSYNFHSASDSEHEFSLYLNGNNISLDKDLFDSYKVTKVDIDSKGSVYIYLTFDFQKSLQSVKIHSTDKIIIEGAFEGCSSLSSFDFQSNNITLLGNAFKDCQSLHEIEWKEGISYISKDAFTGCNITKITYPESKNEIVPGAFSYWSNLKYFGTNVVQYTDQRITLQLSRSITKIGDYAFYNCKSLINAQFPSTVVSFGMHLFDGCENLLSLHINTSAIFDPSNIVDTIQLISGSGYEPYSMFNSQMTHVSSDYYEVAVGKFYKSQLQPFEGTYVTKINKYAFYQCQSLTSVMVGNVDYIGDYAFYGCNRLSDFHISSYVYYIGDYALSGRTSFTEFEIQSISEYIGEQALFSIQDITFPEKFTESVTFKTNFIKENKIPSNLVSDEDIEMKGLAFSTKTELTITCKSLLIDSLTSSSLTKLKIHCSGTVHLKSISLSKLADLEINGKDIILEKECFQSTHKLTNIWINGETIDLGEKSFQIINNINSISLIATKSINLGANLLSNSQSHPTNIEIKGGNVTFAEGSFKDCYFVDVKISGENIFFAKESFASSNDIIPISGDVEIFAQNNIVFQPNSFYVSYIGSEEEETPLSNKMNITGLNQVIIMESAVKLLKFGNLEISAKEMITREMPFEDCQFNNVILNATNYDLSSSIFKDMSSIKNIKITGDLKVIPEYAFYRTSITRIDIKGTNIIGINAFSQNPNLKIVNIEGEISLIQESFLQCTALQSISFTGKNTLIDINSFNGCTELENVTISNIKEIGSSAFSGCTKLRLINDISNCERIGDKSFEMCQSLVIFSIPRKVKEIEENAFISVII